MSLCITIDAVYHKSFLNKQTTGFIILIIFAFCLYTIQGTLGIDPDFGWHYQTGNYILLHGIPKTDHFSYTMPGYSYVDHSWLTDVGISILYNVLGMIGVSAVLSALLVFAIFLVISNSIKRLTKLQFFLSVLLLLSFSRYFAIRPFILSWCFFAVITLILTQRNVWQRWKYFLVGLFIFWANIHGGWLLGLVIFLVYILIYSLEKRQLFISDIIILLSCTAGTLINPYGIGLWHEEWITLFSSTLHSSINEWQPLFSSGVYLSLLLYLTFSILLIIKYFRQFTYHEIIIFVLLLLLGVLSERNIPFWLLWSIPMVLKAFLMVEKEFIVRKFQYIHSIILIELLIPIVCFILLEIYQSLGMAKEFKEETYYPKDAITFLRQHIPTGEILSTYEWGGYLLWKLPQKRVFVDGEMPTWQQKIRGESSNAFEEYLQLFNSPNNFLQAERKYHINTVLLPTQSMSKTLAILKENKYKIFYQDKIATVFEK